MEDMGIILPPAPTRTKVASICWLWAGAVSWPRKCGGDFYEENHGEITATTWPGLTYFNFRLNSFRLKKSSAQGCACVYIYIYIYLNKHVYIYTGICVESTKRGKHIQAHTRRHVPKICKLCKLPGFKTQDSRFWGKLPESRPWLSSRAPCQSALGFKKFSPQSWILNLEPQKIANFANFLDSRLKIQDSGGNFLNPGLGCHPGPHVSQRLDSRSFSQNLESWILNPRKFANFANFLGSRFKILGASWIQALAVIQGPMSVSAWIQKVFLAILNLESWAPKICKLCKLPGFKIQDSRLWELPESRPWLSSRAPCQSALGFKKFFLQSWILNLEPQKFANFANFLDSRLKIPDSEGNFLNPGLDCHPRPHVSQRLDSRSFPTSWILNPRKLRTLQTFLGPEKKAVRGIVVFSRSVTWYL